MGLFQRGASKEIPLTEFAPDLDPTTPGILLDMDNAMPTVKGFQVQNSALPHIYGALPGTPIGSSVAVYSNGTPQHWAGTTSHLYRAFGAMDDPASIWVQADTMGVTPFNATKWRFAQFNDDLIAVGGTGVAPQVANGAAGVFSNLAGGPPNGATLVLAVNGQVMMFVGPTWYVSALNTDNNWTPNIQTQAGSGTLYDFPGSVVAAAQLYRNVIAFKQGAMWLGSYVGGQAIWSFQLISDVTGTWGQESVMTLPDSVAFLGTDDFYVCTGYTPQRIPNSLKEWFFDTADPLYLSSTLARYDPSHSIGYWHFVSKTPPVVGVPDRYVAYNFRAQRWGTGYLNTPCVPTPNYHFGNPTDVQGFYFDTNNVLQTFRGTPGTMRLKTGYYGDPNGGGTLPQLLRVRGKYSIYPSVETLQAYHVRYLGQSDIVGPVGVKGESSWFNLRQYDRYHRVQFSITGSTQPLVENSQLGAEITAMSFMFRSGGDR